MPLSFLAMLQHPKKPYLVGSSSSEEEQRRKGREDLLLLRNYASKVLELLLDTGHTVLSPNSYTRRIVHFVTKFGGAVAHVEMIHPTTEEGYGLGRRGVRAYSTTGGHVVGLGTYYYGGSSSSR